MKKISEAIKRRPIIGWAIFVVVLIIVFLLGLLAASITERRAEIATLYSNKKVEIKGSTLILLSGGLTIRGNMIHGLKPKIWIFKVSIMGI